MPRTIGYHVVIGAYGQWLPGDDRGSWSQGWDDEIGFFGPHSLHAGDAVCCREAAERMKHPPVRLDAAMIDAVSRTLDRCAARSDWSLAAVSICPTHTHLLITFTPGDIDHAIKWIKDRTTKAVHRETAHRGPVWCKGKWRSFVFDQIVWQNTITYIERHNRRDHRR